MGARGSTRTDASFDVEGSVTTPMDGKESAGEELRGSILVDASFDAEGSARTPMGAKESAGERKHSRGYFLCCGGIGEDNNEWKGIGGREEAFLRILPWVCSGSGQLY